MHTRLKQESSLLQEKSPQTERSLFKQLLLPAVFLVLLVLCGQWAGSFWEKIELYIGNVGWPGYLLFIACFVALTVACFPVSVLGFSAGLLFGPGLGLGILFTSGLLSGITMYFVGNSQLSSPIRKIIASRPKLVAFQRASSKQSLRLNILARLSPLNYGLACYTLAMGNTSFTNYLLGLFAILPSMAAQVWFGAAAKQAQAITGRAADVSPVKTVVIIVGVIFFLVLGWQLNKVVKHSLRLAEESE